MKKRWMISLIFFNIQAAFASPCRTSPDYINFNYAPIRVESRNTKQFTPDDFYNPDLSTGDDDASTYPDMDIDR